MGLSSNFEQSQFDLRITLDAAKASISGAELMPACQMEDNPKIQDQASLMVLVIVAPKDRVRSNETLPLFT